MVHHVSSVCDGDGHTLLKCLCGYDTWIEYALCLWKMNEMLGMLSSAKCL